MRAIPLTEYEKMYITTTVGKTVGEIAKDLNRPYSTILWAIGRYGGNPMPDKIDWSMAEIEELKTMKANGCSIREMAHRIGRTTGAITNRLQIEKITKPKKLWTDEEEIELIALKKCGISNIKAGVILNRPTGSVATKIVELRKEGRL